MKKFSFLFSCILFVIPLYAFEPGVWTIIRPDGLYVGGSIQANNPMSGKVIADIAIIRKNELVLITNDNVFFVTDETSRTISTSPIRLRNIPDAERRKVPFSDTKIRPRIVTNGDEGFAFMVSGMTVTTENGQDWEYFHPIASGAMVSPGDLMFTEFTDVFSNSFGWAVAGGLRMRTNSGIPEMDELYRYFDDNARLGLREPPLWYGIHAFVRDGDTGGTINAFLTKAEVEKSGETRPFMLYSVVCDKNSTVWALGGNEKTHLWKIFRGRLQHVKSDVNAIALDQQGNAVIATTEAIMTIDGNSNNNTKVFLEAEASYIAFDNVGTLWYQPPIIRTAAQSEQPPTLSEIVNLRQTIQDRMAEQQTANESAILVRYDPITKKKFNFTVSNSPIKGEIFKIVSDDDNYKYILAGDNDRSLGIYIIKEPEQTVEDWTVLNELTSDREGIEENYWTKSHTSSDGTFVGLNDVRSRQITFHDGNTWRRERYELASTNLGFAFMSVARMNNKVYVGTTNYLYTLENGKMEQTSELNQRSISRLINALEVDGNNRLWIGSNNGLAVFDGQTYTYYGRRTDRGLPNVNILTIRSIGDKVFVGTADGFSVYDGTSWVPFNRRSGLQNNRVSAIAANSKGQVFIASVSILSITNVMNIYQNGELTKEDIPQRITVNDMQFDENDNLWILGTTELICRKATGEYVFFSRRDNNFPVTINQIINNISIVDDTLWLSVGDDTNRSAPAQGFETEIFRRLSSFGGQQVLLRKIK